MDNKESNLLNVQPESCRQPLPPKEFTWNEWQMSHKSRAPKWEMIMLYDPTDMYARISELINPYKRIQTIPSHILWPSPKDGTCACGCGVKLSGRRTRWATSLCSSTAHEVYYIIANAYQRPHFYMDLYYGRKCVECDKEESEVKLFLDHIIPVKHGGGGCWLSNYQWLCHACHVTKTNKDFNRKEFKKGDDLQTTLF